MNTKKTVAEERCYSIVSGPNKDALFDNCKYAYSKTAKLPANFDVVVDSTASVGDSSYAYAPMAIIDVMIISIEHEDGSGDRFNLHGYCKADLDSPDDADTTYELYEFRAYYDSKIRKGRIAFIK